MIEANQIGLIYIIIIGLVWNKVQMVIQIKINLVGIVSLVHKALGSKQLILNFTELISIKYESR